MQYCENCKVSVRGENHVCPLCGGIIRENGEKTDEVFPLIPTIYQEFNLMIRIMILVSVVVIIISFSIDELLSRRMSWSLLVAAGIICMWISLFFIIRKKDNIPKTIVWQVGLIVIFSLLWDYRMGWRGWSIDYILPGVCVGAMIVMPIAAKILKITARDLIVYVLVDIIFGFIPAVFIFFGGLHIKFPSIICVAVSAISLATLILFEGDNMKAELNKRMHI